MSTVAQIQAKAEADAAGSFRRIDAAAETLTDLMRQAHGGEWRLKVDHAVGLIMIIPDFSKEVV